MIITSDILDSIVFSQLQKDVLAEYGVAYSMTEDNFSTTGVQKKSSPVFPFVYMHLISGYETGTDLERDKFVGGHYTYQIDVTDNKSQQRATNVMNSIKSSMKKMAFTNSGLAYTNNSPSVYRKTSRFSRFIDESDIL